MPASNPLLPILIRTLVILNVLDLAGTLTLVMNKFTTEANPSMAFFLAAISALLLWIGRRSSWAVPATLALVGIMSVVVALQIVLVFATVVGH